LFKRLHHRRIERIIQLLRTTFLEQNRAYFAGGTCIALQIREYRESVDIDFLCNEATGDRRHEAFLRMGMLRYVCPAQL
jgi:Nucleotidyl transferase AbiEii toxin, Type IV TA system